MEAARTVKARKSQNVISTLGPAQIQGEGKQTPCGMGGILQPSLEMIYTTYNNSGHLDAHHVPGAVLTALCALTHSIFTTTPLSRVHQ